jgi:two-component system sensor histidine kinase UhpB
MSKTDLPTGENDNVAERNAGYLRALDLHDETGQLLTAILVNLQRLGSGTTGPELRDAVRDTQHLVETLFYSIRNYIRDSGAGDPRHSPPNPELGPALRRLVRGFSRRTGIDVDLAYEQDAERIPGEHKAVFYRVVQEGLTNVFRHSGARTVSVRFSRSESGVELVIEDDGGSRKKGARDSAPRPAVAGAGAGLRGMRERVRIVGGECIVRMVEGRGMSITVVLPYNIS